MELINCEACGNKISENANSCPQCGHVPQDANFYIVGLFKAALVALIGFVLILIAF